MFFSNSACLIRPQSSVKGNMEAAIWFAVITWELANNTSQIYLSGRFKCLTEDLHMRGLYWKLISLISIAAVAMKICLIRLINERYIFSQNLQNRVCVAQWDLTHWMKILHNNFYLNLPRNSPVVVLRVSASLKGLCKKKKRERKWHTANQYVAGNTGRGNLNVSGWKTQSIITFQRVYGHFN